MTEDKDCRKCVYFIGKLHNEPRFMWTHCKAGISNLSIDSAKNCKRYAETYEEALAYKTKELKKSMEWMKPKTKYCPHCGNLIKEDEEEC